MPDLLAPPPVIYHATVLEVIDGDTLKVRVPGWPLPFDPIDVRIQGIDTPEHVRPPAQTACEVKLGLAARDFARTLVVPGQMITVTWSGVHDKYGRLLGRVTLPDGRDLGRTLVAANQARPYGGDAGLHKAPWCDDAAKASAGRP